MKVALKAAILLVFLTSCGGSTSPGMDASSGTDSGPAMDSGGSSDTGVPTDTGISTDTGTPPADTGPVVTDAGACATTPLGQTCDESVVCPAGYSCDLGRCIPQGRETCGGFAGAECPATGHTVCLYRESGGDVGTCLSPSETACVCSLPDTIWICAG
jgi:hypothetical protein